LLLDQVRAQRLVGELEPAFAEKMQFVGTEGGREGLGVVLLAGAAVAFMPQQAGSRRCAVAMPLVQPLRMDALQRLPVLRGFDPSLCGMRQKGAEEEAAGLLMQAEIGKRVVAPGFEDEIERGGLSEFCQNVVFKNWP
jgi:hypothetical protein